MLLGVDTLRRIKDLILKEILRWSPEDWITMKQICERLESSGPEKDDTPFKKFGVSEEFLEKMRLLAKRNKGLTKNDISHAPLIHHSF